MYSTDSNWILPSRQLPAQSQLDSVTLNKPFLQSCMTDFGHVIACLTNDKAA